MQDINDYRRQIDLIDAQLVHLFEQRLNLVRQVADYKKTHQIAVLQSSREEDVLQQAVAALKNPDYAQEIEALFRSMLQISRQLQKREKLPPASPTAALAAQKGLILGFQGVEGSFSEAALVTFFGSDNQRLHYDNFEDVCHALDRQEIDFGILPIENSSTGSVNDTYDLLLKYDFYIVGEQSIGIEQHLLGLPGTKLEQIKEVYSHPQGFAQSSIFLKKHRDWQQIPYYNTAISAKLVAETGDSGKAAIASQRAAALYGLEILQPCVNDQKENNTLFVMIGRQPLQTELDNKVSVVFWLKNQPGALAHMLTIFAENQINMTKIESRPVQYRPWEYVFYVDLEGNLTTPHMQETLQQAKETAQKFRLLGSYPRYDQ